jgi:hypothetical protein
MKLFESIIYPYRKGDILDGVMKLSIKGGWKGSGRGAGVLIGLTLGLASAGVGPSMTGVHYATAVLSKGATETGKYTVHVESNVTWGMAANTTEVSNKSDDLQRRKIAVEMAKKFEADRTLIIKAFGK